MGIALLVVVAVIVVVFGALGWWSGRDGHVAAGLVDGRLAACGPAPNCVSSEAGTDEAHAVAALAMPGGDADAAAAASAAPSEPKVSLGGVMVALESRLKENWGIAGEFDATLVFRAGGEAWTVDLRKQVEEGASRVREGEGEGERGAAFTVSAADLVALARGETSAQRLFQAGKLRVDGELRLAHSLDMLFKELL